MPSLVPACEVHHFLERNFFVLVGEKVNPDQIKSVQELFACGVCGVVAVRKFIVKNLNSCTAFGGDIVEPALHCGRGVDFVQKFFYYFLYSIGTAERSDNALLCERVLLFFFDRVGDNVGLP